MTSTDVMTSKDEAMLCYSRRVHSALPDENRTNVYAVSRPNMSTASLLRRPAHRTRGGAVNKTPLWPKAIDIVTVWHTCEVFDHIQHILHILHILHIPKCCALGLPAAGRPGLRLNILHIFHIIYIFAYKNRGGSYSAHILHICCILVILKQGGLYAKGGFNMPTGVSYFAYSTCVSYLTYAAYGTYLPYFTYFTYFTYSGYLFNRICWITVNMLNM
jgi:hypothetical protein